MRRPLTAIVLTLLAGCATDASREAGTPQPPLAEQRPFTVVSPHGNREDEYYWLRDDTRSDPDVIAYLEAEHAYKTAMLAHTEPLQKRLYEEMVARIPQEDATAPYREDGFWYATRYVAGGEHPVHVRRRSPEAPEEVLLDGNAMSKGHPHFEIGSFEVSPDGRYLLYAVDTVGRLQYTLRVRDLARGELLPDEIGNAQTELAWAADGKAFLWIEKDLQTLRGVRVRRHVLGTDPATDAIVYEETDPSFYLEVMASRSGRHLFIYSWSTVSSEWRYARADDPRLDFKVAIPRERGHEYQLEDLDDRFVIRTNFEAPNFRIVTAPMEGAHDRSTWRDLIAHRDDALVERFRAFRDFLAVEERSGGLLKIRIKRWSDGNESLIAADEPSYTMLFGKNPEQDTGTLRYVYTSLTTPETTYELDVASGERRLLKRQKVLGGFDPARYATELLWAPARDGKRIPVSVLYAKRTPRDGTAPMLVEGYGAYASSFDPEFQVRRLSLIDRGFVYALAHIRGGQELGRAWYEGGRLLEKKNTFTDFIDATEFLIARGYGAKDKVFARGRSAGGLLMGAVVNMRPDLYAGVAVGVPFVDVVTTMLDETIPLTSNEFDEWGNPKEKAYYDYQLSYSPYDQVRPRRYPAMLVTTGFHDSQVQYFEPAKWVARLRRLKQGDAPLLFHVDMQTGHAGKAGRFERYRDYALEYAFFLDRAAH